MHEVLLCFQTQMMGTQKCLGWACLALLVVAASADVLRFMSQDDLRKANSVEDQIHHDENQVVAGPFQKVGRQKHV
jgi:hypothetical protein